MSMQAILFYAVAALAPSVHAETPTATLKSKNGEVDRLLKIKADPGTPGDQKRKSDIKAVATSLFDYPELIKRAMADHWQQITPAEQTDLVGTLKQLIERNYVKQLRGNLDYQVSYKEEKVSGEDATVGSVVKIKTRGKSTEAEIIYKLRNVGGKWMVWDVITDESSLMRSYKSSFHKIITESGFPELMKRMKNKLKEPEDGALEAKSDAKADPKKESKH